MKKFYLLILMLCCSIGLFAQAKSIEVDCQTPGWLSSKINYGDQLTVENLTVTGYINGTDIKFIRELNKNRKLKGVLNLEYANIVIGGEAYYTYSGSKYTTKDNILTDFIFANLDSLQKVVLPKTLNQLEGGHQFMGTYVDTLIINGELEDIYIGYAYDSNFWKTRCVYIPEGVKNIDFGYLFRDLPNKEFFLPSTLETVNGLTAALTERNITFHCSSTNPENIKVVSYTNNNYSFFDGGPIYVPEGTAEKYKNSIFRKLTIIEDVAVNNIKFEEDSIIAYVGDNGLLNTNVYPSNAIHKEILYSSSNEDILKITESGEYTCIKFGEVLVYAFSYNKEFSDTCKVKVYEHTTGVDIEPNVPYLHSRYGFYRKLKDNGFKVGIRVQPFIPGITTTDVIDVFKDADSFTIEGLKLVPQNKEHKEYLLELTGLKSSDFTQMGLLNLKPEIREKLYKPFIEKLNHYGISYSIADNDMHHIGTNKCCCGDALIHKSTDFNNTAMIYKYGDGYTKEQLDNELVLSNIGCCKCNHLFTSNRQEGCTTVQEFYDKRFYRKSSPFSPDFLYKI